MRWPALAICIAFFALAGCASQDTALQTQVNAQSTRVAQLETALAATSVPQPVANAPQSTSTATALPSSTASPIPTSTPTQAPTSTSTPTPIPPTATPTPVPVVVRSYAQRNNDGSLWTVHQWSNGRFTHDEVEPPSPRVQPAVPSYSYLGISVGTIGGSEELPIKLYAGNTLEGHFSVNQGKDISFWITDPFDDAVLNPGKVVGNWQFSLVARETGVYRLHFSNCLTCAGRTIGLYYRIY